MSKLAAQVRPDRSTFETIYTNMADKQHWTAAQVADALTKNKGMVYYAAKSLGCSHTTIYNYAKRYTSVKEAMEYQDGEFVDTAELKLRQAVINGESWAVLFALRTKGKNRGYVERQEITGKDGGDITVKVLRGVSMDEL